MSVLPPDNSQTNTPDEGMMSLNIDNREQNEGNTKGLPLPSDPVHSINSQSAPMSMSTLHNSISSTASDGRNEWDEIKRLLNKILPLSKQLYDPRVNNTSVEDTVDQLLSNENFSREISNVYLPYVAGEEDLSRIISDTKTLVGTLNFMFKYSFDYTHIFNEYMRLILELQAVEGIKGLYQKLQGKIKVMVGERVYDYLTTYNDTILQAPDIFCSPIIFEKWKDVFFSNIASFKERVGSMGASAARSEAMVSYIIHTLNYVNERYTSERHKDGRVEDQSSLFIKSFITSAFNKECNIEVCKYLIEVKMIKGDELIKRIIKSDCVELLLYLHRKGNSLDNSIIAQCLNYDSYNCLKYLLQEVDKTQKPNSVTIYDRFQLAINNSALGCVKVMVKDLNYPLPENYGTRFEIKSEDDAKFAAFLRNEVGIVSNVRQFYNICRDPQEDSTLELARYIYGIAGYKPALKDMINAFVIYGLKLMSKELLDYLYDIMNISQDDLLYLAGELALHRDPQYKAFDYFKDRGVKLSSFAVYCLLHKGRNTIISEYGKDGEGIIFPSQSVEIVCKSKYTNVETLKMLHDTGNFPFSIHHLCMAEFLSSKSDNGNEDGRRDGNDERRRENEKKINYILKNMIIYNAEDLQQAIILDNIEQVKVACERLGYKLTIADLTLARVKGSTKVLEYSKTTEFKGNFTPCSH